MSADRPTVAYDTSYQPPRGNVLLLSCMDLRLLDDTARFMQHDNLVNRYDHVVFAGAALGALGAPGAKDAHGKPVDVAHWKQAFEEHLWAAVELHNIQDVYILEHRNCGAYSQVFHVCGNFDESEEEQAAELRCHLKYAIQLEAEIAKWAAKHGKSLQTHKFLMDLRGGVSQLCEQPAKKRKSSRKRS